MCDDGIMEAISDEQPIILTAKERKRLASYLDALIEMHFEYKRNHKGSNEEDVLLNLKSSISLGGEPNEQDLAVGRKPRAVV